MNLIEEAQFPYLKIEIILSTQAVVRDKQGQVLPDTQHMDFSFVLKGR